MQLLKVFVFNFLFVSNLLGSIIIVIQLLTLTNDMTDRTTIVTIIWKSFIINFYVKGKILHVQS